MIHSTDERGLQEAKEGPVTQDGKEAVRWNATRHGIRSPAPVAPGVEKKEDWEEHRDGVLESLSPVGHLEFVLAERVALLSWRLHCVTRFETESIALYQVYQEKLEEDLARERRFGSVMYGSSVHLMEVYSPKCLEVVLSEVRKPRGPRIHRRCITACKSSSLPGRWLYSSSTDSAG